MKKTKKILSLVLALMMIFSSVGILAEDATTTALSFTDVVDGTKTADAISKLVAYGIMNGYPDGSFKPDGSITRAEVAAVIVRFEKLADNLPADAVTGFSDLDNDDSSAWARPYVKAAVDAGIINGFEDGTYRASEPVTYEQLIKMIICAINYDIIATSEKSKLESMGQATTWSSGYIAAANRYGITLNALTADVTKPASRGTVAMVTSNALAAPVLNIVTDNEGNVSYEMGDTTVGEEGRDKIVEVDGYVSGNYYTSLTTQAPQIGKNELLVTVDGTERAFKMSEATASIADVADLLGKQVKLYYSEIDREIIRIIPDSTNISIVIKEEDKKNITDTEINYADISGRTKSENISGYKFIYNGKYMDTMVGSDLENAGQYQFTNGKIELLKNNHVGIVKVTNYFVGVVKNYVRNDYKLTFRYGATYEGNSEYRFESSTYARPEIYVDGAKTELDSLTLSNYNVVNILKSPAGSLGNIINKVYVTKRAYSGRGEVTSKSNTVRKVGIDGKDIYLTKFYDNFTTTSDDQKAPFEVGHTYRKIYLDHTGQIAAVNYSPTATGSDKYGYLLFAGENRDRTGYAIRFIDANGNDSVLNVKSSVKVDGQKVTDSNLASTLLSKIAPEDISAFTGNGATNITYHQPIRYTESGGAVDTIDTIVSVGGGEGDSFSRSIKYSDGDSTVKSAGSILEQAGTTFRVGSNTKVIYVPDNRASYTEYTSLTNSKAFPASETIRVEAFDLNDDSVASYVVVYGTDPSLKFDNSSPYMIVTGKNYYGGSELYLVGYVNGSTGDPKEVKVSVDGYKSSVAESSAENVGKGDVIRYLTDASGEIISVMIWYDADNPVQEVDFADYAFDADHNNVRRYQISSNKSGAYSFSYGTPTSYVEDINNDTGKVMDIVLQLSFTIPEDTTSGDSWKTTANKTFKCIDSGKLVPVYEITSDGVVWVETESLEVNVASASEPSRVIVLHDGSTTPQAKAIYIIK